MENNIMQVLMEWSPNRNEQVISITKVRDDIAIIVTSHKIYNARLTGDNTMKFEIQLIGDVL